MRAVVLSEFGGPEKLAAVTLECREPGEKEVLVEVAACGVCFQDTLVRVGRLSTVRLPRVLGHEFAGRVAAVGPRVASVTVGDRVAAVPKAVCGQCRFCRAGHPSLCLNPLGHFGVTVDGGYAEFVCANEAALCRVPEGVTSEAAAIAACAIGPAYNGLRVKSDVRPGATVAITGASGGLGSHAIQVARLCAARVIAVTGSPSKVDAIREAGADEVILSETGDFSKQVRDLTDGLGADVVFDTVGGATLSASLRSLRNGGRLVLVGDLTGTPVSINPAVLILKELSIIVGKFASLGELREILELLSQGRLHARLSTTLELDAAAQAHARLEARQAMGRTVLLP